jgi:hypothetical protein
MSLSRDKAVLGRCWVGGCEDRIVRLPKFPPCIRNCYIHTHSACVVCEPSLFLVLNSCEVSRARVCHAQEIDSANGRVVRRCEEPLSSAQTWAGQISNLNSLHIALSMPYGKLLMPTRRESLYLITKRSVFIKYDNYKIMCIDDVLPQNAFNTIVLK